MRKDIWLFVAWKILQVTVDCSEIFKIINKSRNHGKIIDTIKNVYLITECTILCQQTNDCIYSSLSTGVCSLYSYPVKEDEIKSNDKESCKTVFIKLEETSQDMVDDCKIPINDCLDLHQSGFSADGINYLNNGNQIVCDQVRDGGGWTVISARLYPFKEDFNQPWNKYRDGFGDFRGEFWYGNQKIHELTSQEDATNTTLLIEIDSMIFKYHGFQVANQSDDYRLTIDVPYNHQNTWYHLNGTAFSTYDKGEEKECAASTDAGWWWPPSCGVFDVSFTRLIRHSSLTHLHCGSYEYESKTKYYQYGNKKGILKIRRNKN